VIDGEKIQKPPTQTIKYMKKFIPSLLKKKEFTIKLATKFFDLKEM